MSNVTFENLDKCLAGGEKALNVLGWVPFVSTATGAARMIAGKVQAIAFAILAAFSFSLGYIMDDQKLLATADRSTRYIWHGFANICRGFVEAIPIGGNLLTFLYDSEPTSRMRYPNESLTSRSLVPFRV